MSDFFYAAGALYVPGSSVQSKCEDFQTTSPHTNCRPIYIASNFFYPAPFSYPSSARHSQRSPWCSRQKRPNSPPGRCHMIPPTRLACIERSDGCYSMWWCYRTGTGGRRARPDGRAGGDDVGGLRHNRRIFAGPGGRVHRFLNQKPVHGLAAVAASRGDGGAVPRRVGREHDSGTVAGAHSVPEEKPWVCGGGCRRGHGG